MVIKYMMIDNFTNSTIENYQVDHSYVPSYQLRINKELLEEEQARLQLTYHLGGWQHGNGAMYVLFNQKTSIGILPKKIGVYLHSKGRVPWLRATFIDGENQKRIINLTEESTEWYGWKYIDGTIGEDWPTPIYLDSIYAVEVDKQYREDNTYQGSLIFGSIYFVLVDDIDKKGPYFHDQAADTTVIYTPNIDGEIYVYDEMSGVDPESVRLLINGSLHPHCFNQATGLLTFTYHASSQTSYEIRIHAKDKAGNEAIPFFRKQISVDLTKDVDPPVLSAIAPVIGETVYSRRPRITFHLVDVKSGIDEDAIHVKVNGEDLTVFYDQKTGWCYALPKKSLSLGENNLVIHAMDRAGNKMPNVRHTFFVEDLKTSDKRHDLIVIPDTHDSEYLQLALQSANKEKSSLILHMGDIVDGATDNEYEVAHQLITEQTDKTILHVPGNHESFLGHLNTYRDYFGSATYHVEYGDILLIILNSAFQQSISVSDSTQFHYVQHLLDYYPSRTIVIATHVPFRDSLGTSHEMETSDVEELQSILQNDQDKHPNRMITVLFGHLHVIQRWKEKGIHYYITGNHAKKGYVDETKGNLLGYGIFQFNENNVEYTYKPYLQSLFIKYNEKHVDRVRMKKGKAYRFTFHGEIDILQTQKTIDLANYPMLPVKTSIEDEEIAYLLDGQTVLGKKSGKTILTVSIDDVITTAELVVE